MKTRTPVPRDQRPPLPAFAPVPRKCNRHDGWTPARQKAFIEAFADTGSVGRAAGQVINEAHEIVPGVAFGRPEWVLSPAYWAALLENSPGNFDHFEPPRSLKAEVCFWLLGGHGIPRAALDQRPR